MFINCPNWIRQVALGLVLSLLGFSVQVSASNSLAGTSAMDFIRLDHSVKSISLGNAIGATRGLDAMTLNAASLASTDGRAVMFRYLQYVQDISYLNLSGSYALPKGVFGFNIGHIDLGASDRTTVSNPSGTGERFSNNGQQILLNYAVPGVFHGIDAGASLKVAEMTLDSLTASTVGLDLGVQWHLNRAWHLGASAQNITLKKQRFIVQEAQLPFEFSLSIAHDTQLFLNPLSVVGMLGFPTDDNAYVGLGADYLVKDRLNLRVGYSGFGDAFRPSLGLGLVLSPFNIDFAYRPSDTLGDTYRIGISVQVGTY